MRGERERRKQQLSHQNESNVRNTVKGIDRRVVRFLPTAHGLYNFSLNERKLKTDIKTHGIPSNCVLSVCTYYTPFHFRM